MDTIQINHALMSRRDIPMDIFKGTFALNQIPYVYQLNTPFAFIFNNDPWPGKGNHWIAVYHDGKVCDYFDSLGQTPIPGPIAYSNTVCYNDKRIQSDCSSVCGEYCIAFLYYRLKGIPMSEFVSNFTPNLVENDFRIYKSVHKHFDILPHKRSFPVMDLLCVQVSRPSFIWVSLYMYIL